MPLNALHPIVRDWFAQHFGSATEPQARAWPAIRSGENVLISAPTGSGKTLAAFLICLDDLVRAGLDGSAARHDAGAVCLAAEGAQQRHPQESRCAACRDRGRSQQSVACCCRRSAPPCAPATRRRPNASRWSSTRRTFWSPRPESLFILLTAERSRAGAAQRANGHRRRDPRDGRRQARLRISRSRWRGSTISSRKPAVVARSGSACRRP